MSQICDYSPVFIILNKLEHVVGFGIQLLLLALERLELPLQVGDIGLEEVVDVPALLGARALLLQKFPLGQECLILALQTLNLEEKEGLEGQHVSSWNLCHGERLGELEGLTWREEGKGDLGDPSSA